MNKKLRVGFLLIILLFLTSCVERRFESMKMKKAMREYDKEGLVLSDGSFYPDKITDFSVDDYLKWYKGLSHPLKLQLPKVQRPKELTKEQRVEDFNYFFDQIKNNYPFFGVLKRKHKMDFLNNYDKYKGMVEACKNDEEFRKTMEEVMLDLKNNHTRIADRDYVLKTMKYFSKNWKSPSIYYEFLNLNRQVVRNRYGIDGVQSDTEAKLDLDRRSAIFDNISDNNLEFEEAADGIALLKVKSMASSDKYSQDLKVLKEFLQNKHLYKALAIDIRGNTGGNMEYWQNFLLPKLITGPKTVTNNLFFKESDESKLIFADNSLNVERLSNVDISAIKLDHADDLKRFDFYMKEVLTINPDTSDKDYGYPGSMYLLVDGEVFSAAEGFANFVKYSNTATLIGQNTGGDGITLGVINSVMPNSGLVFTYTNTLGYDPAGKINEENPTAPDILSKSYRDSITTIQQLMGAKN
ncbi:S41 family peptidase [Anaerococcus tetradius]|uniref:Peptidase, S41 family n=1 Tax=Anaerococcus tetradius ATCC 35098 TaxID=525255 RepID=C2CJ20_9FIRM|nr:S41 family peptidase [Anaerococcus tetradius]EEI82459.1 peptidase, S41 family [Anaerococcus tetradius ATCC 35098]